MGWLSRFRGRAGAPDLARFGRLEPGDEVWADGEPWKVSATLLYKSADGEWPAVKLTRGVDTTWAALEGDAVSRYEPVTVDVDADGVARWNGRIYRRDEFGTATIARAAGDVEARAGDALGYQVLRSPDDPGAWISVESWKGGYVEISAGRRWAIDKIVPREGRRP